MHNATPGEGLLRLAVVGSAAEGYAMLSYGVEGLAAPRDGRLSARLGALGLDRYTTYTPISGCPRCQGALFDSMCISCGYDGPTRAVEPGERTRGAQPSGRWGRAVRRG